MAPLDARAFGHRHARRRLHAIATQRPRRGRGAIISYAYVLASTARHRDRLSILDSGGGVGRFLPLSKALLSDVAFDYHVKDVPGMCSLGRQLSPDVHFHDDDSWRGRQYDLVVSSSAFQFTEEWQSTLKAFGRSRPTISSLPASRSSSAAPCSSFSIGLRRTAG